MRYLFLFLIVPFLLSSSCDNTVEPDLDPPKVRITGTVVEEGDTNSEASVEVELSKAWEKDIAIEYAVKDGSAAKNQDYIGSDGTVTIPAGDVSTKISITVIGDTLKEPDETVKISLRNTEPAIIVDGDASITIRNEDEYIYIPEDGYSTPTSYAGYKMVWQDEFKGTSLSADWTYEIGNSGWGNNELQYYTDGDNAEVKNGYLTIEAREESFQGAPYTSTRIITEGKQSFKYGRVDIRALLPEGQGVWPALWMLGSNISSIGWPACGEIDIMEMIGHQPGTVHGTLHWENANGDHASAGKSTTLPSGEKFIEEFHVFSIIWDQNSIKWYVDDVKYNEIDITKSDMTEFHSPHFFIFNVAVGGNWPGYPDNTTTFPQRMVVDYVRVFEEI